MDFSLSVDASFLFSPQVEILQPGARVDGVTGGLGGVLAHFRIDGDLRVQAEQLQRLRLAGDPQRRRLQVTKGFKFNAGNYHCTAVVCHASLKSVRGGGELNEVCFNFQPRCGGLSLKLLVIDVILQLAGREQRRDIQRPRRLRRPCRPRGALRGRKRQGVPARLRQQAQVAFRVTGGQQKNHFTREY